MLVYAKSPNLPSGFDLLVALNTHTGSLPRYKGGKEKDLLQSDENVKTTKVTPKRVLELIQLCVDPNFLR
jgi:hypothetical protein